MAKKIRLSKVKNPLFVIFHQFDILLLLLRIIIFTKFKINSILESYIIPGSNLFQNSRQTHLYVIEKLCCCKE